MLRLLIYSDLRRGIKSLLGDLHIHVLCYLNFILMIEDLCCGSLTWLRSHVDICGLGLLFDCSDEAVRWISYTLNPEWDKKTILIELLERYKSMISGEGGNPAKKCKNILSCELISLCKAQL